ncbi:MAG: hypothetical protein U1G07_08985 [Verrucomicrobiota bacterium]
MRLLALISLLPLQNVARAKFRETGMDGNAAMSKRQITPVTVAGPPAEQTASSSPPTALLALQVTSS